MKIPARELSGALTERVPPLIIIAGPEEFLRREAVETVRKHLGERSQELDRRSIKSPSDADLVALIDDLRTPSLFAGAQAIVVDPAEKWLALDPDLWLHAIQSPWAAGHLVLVSDGLDGRTKLAKMLAKQALWVQVERPFHRPPPWKPKARPWENDLNQWIVARARGVGLRIDPSIAHLLQGRIGPRLADLASAIDRFETVLAGDSSRTITAERVAEHTPDGEESGLFEVVDALFLGDRADALRQLRELLRRGSVDAKGSRTTDPTALLLQCLGVALSRARQLRTWHEFRAGGASEEETAAEIGVGRPFIPRLLQQAAATPPPALERTIDRLIRADCDLKSGAGPTAEELFERIAVGR